MRRQFVRVSATTAVVLAIGTGGALLGAGVADASSSVLADTCSGTFDGSPGEPAEMRQSAVIGPVTDVVRSIPLIGAGTADAVANAMNAKGPIPLGAFPSSGSRTVSGGQIATQVVNEVNTIPVLGPVLSLVDSGVTQKLTALCGMTLNAIPLPLPPPPPAATSNRPAPPPSQAAPPPQNGSPGQPAAGQPPAPQPGEPAGVGSAAPGTGGLGDYSGLGTVPSYDYGSLPGMFTAPSVDYTSLPGTGSTPDGTSDTGQNRADSPTNLAGAANPLSGLSGQGIGMPVALAVLALGGVTAGLVRAWVLRRSLAA